MGAAWIVYRKELKEILRDRRTLMAIGLAALATPLVLFVIAPALDLWARTAGSIVACLSVMGVAIRAANSIGNERDRQTFDDLLTTPLSSTSILGAKFLGSLCSVRLGWVWLGAIYAIAFVALGVVLMTLRWRVSLGKPGIYATTEVALER